MSSLIRTLQPWRDGAADFLAWWRDELWDLVPESVRARLVGREATIVLMPAATGVRLLEEASGSITPLHDAPSVPVEEAAALAARRMAEVPGTRVGVRIARQSCFRRSVELPAAARADAANIVNLDLERSTPFRLKDVYTAAYVEPGPAVGGKVKAVQLIAKREAIDPVLDALKAAGVTADFVDCSEQGAATVLPVNFLAARENATAARLSGLVTAPRALAGLAAVLAVMALGLTLWRNHSALEDVQASVAEARTRAATVRGTLETSGAAVAELGRLQRLKLGQIPAIELIEEVTRLLPDSVWITDMRIEGDALDLSGLARQGSSLPPLFERSKLFADASLTAPLTFDQQEDKERFSLRVRVRHPGSEGGAQAPDGTPAEEARQ